MSIEAIQATTLSAPDVAEQTATRPTAEIAALAARVERLEGENRQMRRETLLVAAITTIAAGIVATLLAQDTLPTRSSNPQAFHTPRRLSAEAFVLTDAQGQPRAELKFIPIPPEPEMPDRARRR